MRFVHRVLVYALVTTIMEGTSGIALLALGGPANTHTGIHGWGVDVSNFPQRFPSAPSELRRWRCNSFCDSVVCFESGLLGCWRDNGHYHTSHPDR